MLVLTRKVEQAIVFPQSGIVVTVLDIQGQRVRVGISAPDHIQVHRLETWERIRENDLFGQANLAVEHVDPDKSDCEAGSSTSGVRRAD